MVTRKTVATKKVAKKAASRKSTAKTVAPRKTLPMVEIVEVILPTAASAAPVDKPKLVRDSFTMPKAEYELLAALKVRLLMLSKATKKSELLRAGVVLLSTLSDAALLGAVDRIPSLKTGRPKKSKDPAKAAKKKA